jgi:hypothetical protein
VPLASLTSTTSYPLRSRIMFDAPTCWWSSVTSKGS